MPDHKEPPFSQSKVYHSKVKLDASTLKLEVTRQWKAYMKSGRQPRPSNWKIDKCIEYLMENPIPTLEVFDLDWIESELKEWKGIQEMVNESQQREDERILHHTFVEFWGLPPLIPLLQCVNRLGFEICSVDSCQSEQGSLVTLI